MEEQPENYGDIQFETQTRNELKQGGIYREREVVRHREVLSRRAMAAELFPGIFPGLLLDVVDDEWAQDKLPNDDIPFPPGICPPADELDESNQEQIANLDKWNELALHQLQ